MLVLLTVLAVGADALMFYLTPGQEKCFTDEFAYDVLVSGDYRIASAGQDVKTLRFSVRPYYVCVLLLSLARCPVVVHCIAASKSQFFFFSVVQRR